MYWNKFSTTMTVRSLLKVFMPVNIIIAGEPCGQNDKNMCAISYANIASILHNKEHSRYFVKESSITY